MKMSSWQTAELNANRCSWPPWLHWLERLIWPHGLACLLWCRWPHHRSDLAPSWAEYHAANYWPARGETTDYSSQNDD